jgi:hypothetical protein
MKKQTKTIIIIAVTLIALIALYKYYSPAGDSRGVAASTWSSVQSYCNQFPTWVVCSMSTNGVPSYGVESSSVLCSSPWVNKCSCSAVNSGSCTAGAASGGTSTYTCSDSDGGSVPNTWGSVLVKYGTSTSQFREDTCADANSVMEYTCNGNDAIQGNTLACSNGCVNGACNAGSTLSTDLKPSTDLISITNLRTKDLANGQAKLSADFKFSKSGYVYLDAGLSQYLGYTGIIEITSNACHGTEKFAANERKYVNANEVYTVNFYVTGTNGDGKYLTRFAACQGCYVLSENTDCIDNTNQHTPVADVTATITGSSVTPCTPAYTCTATGFATPYNRINGVCTPNANSLDCDYQVKTGSTCVKGTTGDKPDQVCIIPPNCGDGKKNGDETAIDCGGSCAACDNCGDGKKNGDETAIDCGGRCTQYNGAFWFNNKCNLCSNTQIYCNATCMTSGTICTSLLQTGKHVSLTESEWTEASNRAILAAQCNEFSDCSSREDAKISCVMTEAADLRNKAAFAKESGWYCSGGTTDISLKGAAKGIVWLVTGTDFCGEPATGTCRAGSSSSTQQVSSGNALSMTYADWKDVSFGTKLITLCTTSKDCTAYTDDEGKDYKVTCLANSAVKAQLASGTADYCADKGGNLKQTITWGAIGAGTACAGSIIATVVTVGAASPSLTICGLAAIGGGAIGAGAGLEFGKGAVLDCEKKTVTGIQGACIASAPFDVCQYLAPLNVFGMDDACVGGGIIAFVGFIIVALVFNEMSKPQNKRR